MGIRKVKMTNLIDFSKNEFNSFWLKNLNLAILGSGDPYGAVQEPFNFFALPEIYFSPKGVIDQIF